MRGYEIKDLDIAYRKKSYRAKPQIHKTIRKVYLHQSQAVPFNSIKTTIK